MKKILFVLALAVLASGSIVACAKSQAAQSTAKADPPKQLPPGVKSIPITALDTKDGRLTAHERALELENLALKMQKMSMAAEEKLKADLQSMLDRQTELMAGINVPVEHYQIVPKTNEILYAEQKAAPSAPTASTPEATPNPPAQAQR